MKLSVIMPARNAEKTILRAIRSIPNRKDVEIIVIDDCSEDGTYDLVQMYRKYTTQNIRLYRNAQRGYPCTCINNGIELSYGDYFTQIDSDDYVLTDEMNYLLSLDRNEDVIFFDNMIDSGEIWKADNVGMCDHICWYKKAFVGDIRQGYGTWGQGWNFHNKIMKKNPTTYYYHRVLYHYTYPQEGSTFDLGKRGLI